MNMLRQPRTDGVRAAGSRPGMEDRYPESMCAVRFCSGSLLVGRDRATPEASSCCCEDDDSVLAWCRTGYLERRFRVAVPAERC